MPNCKTIAICNQKGGTGKTTTTVNLGVGLARLGKKVLLVDADPQGDLTTCLGWRDNDSLTTTITDKLSGVIREDHSDPQSGILHHEENVDLLPANIELSAMEMMLVTAMSRETILRSYLSKVKDNYDYVLIDCMPSLGMVTLNALAAADSVIIPVQAQYLPAKGMTQLMQTIGKVRQYINPSLRIDGILLNIVDNRTNLAKSTADALRKNFGSVIKIYRSSIPMAVKAAEVASKGVSIYKYEPSSPVARAYIDNYHTEVGRNLFHICEFAERMEQGGCTYAPMEPPLPPMCYSILPSTGEVIQIDRWQKGYTATSFNDGNRAENEAIKDKFNEKLGVSKAQEQAMLAGSMIRWDSIAAKPKSYDENGKAIKPKDYER